MFYSPFIKHYQIIVILIALFSLNIAFAWEDEREEAMELTPNIENGKDIYQRVCVTCHQETGWADGSDIGRQQKPGFFPQLAGQHRDVIIKQLVDIRAGNRDNPMMYPFTLDKYIGSTQGIADVAAYITTLPIDPTNNNIGPGFDVELGKDLYRTNCKKCHGISGEGSNEDIYPKIQGQHYNYLLRQFIWIRDGKRRNANRKMMHQIERFTFREMSAVIDYVSRIKASSAENKDTITENKETTKKKINN